MPALVCLREGGGWGGVGVLYNRRLRVVAEGLLKAITRERLFR